MSWSITGTRRDVGSSTWSGDVNQFLGADGSPSAIADARAAVAAAEALADAVIAGGGAHPVSMTANGHRDSAGGISINVSISITPPVVLSADAVANSVVMQPPSNPDPTDG